MTDDPAVRSVRIAVALCDRFAELLKGPDTVAARKQSGALFGVSGNQDDLSLRIGEVQQIYPEIWRHLDDARTAFAARGIDLTAYDQIRASEGLALGAAVDVKHTRYGYGNHAVDETVKSANFNRDGLARARAACDALVGATPQIDWAAIAKAEAEDPNIKAFTRSTTTKRYVMFGLLAAVIAAPFVYVGNSCREKQAKIDARQAAWQEAEQLSDGERAALGREIEEARTRLAAAHAAWPAAVAPAALAALAPSANPCPYRFAAPTARAAESFVQYGSIDGNYFGTGTFASYGAAEPVRPDELAAAALTAERIDQRHAAGTATRADRARLRDLAAHVVFFVIDAETRPAATTGTTYTPGAVTGRAYVFSTAQARIACMARVDVRNAPGLTTSPRDDEATAMLYRDLEVKIRQAIATNLRAL